MYSISLMLLTLITFRLNNLKILIEHLLLVMGYDIKALLKSISILFLVWQQQKENLFPFVSLFNYNSISNKEIKQFTFY